MGLMIVPIKKEKLDEWKAWTQKLREDRSKELKDLNKCYELARHSVWFAETGDGPAAVVLHEGSGADSFMSKLSESTHSFDSWFREDVEEIHGMNLNQPPPGPLPEQMI